MGKHDSSNSDNLLLREIYKKLMSIEGEVEKLKSRPEYHINVEKMEVQQLENLVFQLDTLDIEDLSGTLNIGNNFGVKKPVEKTKEKGKKRSNGKKTSIEKEDS
jgi:Spore germination protein GerPC